MKLDKYVYLYFNHNLENHSLPENKLKYEVPI